MTPLENDPTIPTDDALPVALGQASLGGNASPVAPPFDIRVDAIGPAHYAPAGAMPYTGTAERGPKIRDFEDQAEKAIAYAQTVFPDSSFTLVGSGVYGIVLRDDTGRAFKVYRSAYEGYSKCEQEAGAVAALSDPEGGDDIPLTPQVLLFVDAGQQYRLDTEHYQYTEFGFGDIQIPRQDSGKQLPILVMDFVETEPLTSAEPTKFADGFCRAVRRFQRHNIQSASWDSPDVLVNKQTGEVVMLDVGSLSQAPVDPDETPEAKQQRNAQVVSDIAIYFDLQASQGQIQAAYRQGGLDAVRDLLVRLKQSA